MDIRKGNQVVRVMYEAGRRELAVFLMSAEGICWGMPQEALYFSNELGVAYSVAKYILRMLFFLYILCGFLC